MNLGKLHQLSMAELKEVATECGIDPKGLKRLELLEAIPSSKFFIFDETPDDVLIESILNKSLYEQAIRELVRRGVDTSGSRVGPVAASDSWELGARERSLCIEEEKYKREELQEEVKNLHAILKYVESNRPVGNVVTVTEFVKYLMRGR